MPADIALLAPPKVGDVGGKHGSPLVLNDWIATYGAGPNVSTDPLRNTNKVLYKATSDANVENRGPIRFTWLYNPGVLT